MSEITYNNIKPLLILEEQRGRSMYCTFECPVSGFSITASASIAMSTGGRMANRAQKTFQRRLLSSARATITRSITKVVGRNLLSQIGRDLTNTAMSSVSRNISQPKFSKGDKHDAVVAAFEKVAHNFVWDSSHKRWVATSTQPQQKPSEFEQQLQKTPITELYDLGIMARMLTEIVNADNRITQDEKAFLAEFVPENLGSVRELLQRPPLSTIELEEMTLGPVRETLIMLAWGIALSDESLSAEEEGKIAYFTAALNVSQNRADVMKHYAQSFILDQLFRVAYQSGKFDARKRQDVITYATRMGMTTEEAERADVAYRKRAGVV